MINTEQTEVKKENEIDFSRVQLLMHNGASGLVIVLTNGKHNDALFSGTVVFTKNPLYKLGSFRECRVKNKYSIYIGEISIIEDGK